MNEQFVFFFVFFGCVFDIIFMCFVLGLHCPTYACICAPFAWFSHAHYTDFFSVLEMPYRVQCQHITDWLYCLDQEYLLFKLKLSTLTATRVQLRLQPFSCCTLISCNILSFPIRILPHMRLGMHDTIDACDFVLGLLEHLQPTQTWRCKLAARKVK